MANLIDLNLQDYCAIAKANLLGPLLKSLAQDMFMIRRQARYKCYLNSNV